jgi:diadenosine tetraphosphate (Ap4A) HIT family hydrolase
MLLDNVFNPKVKIHTKRNTFCTFCDLRPDEVIIKAYKDFFILIDRYPLMEGHLLIAPKEHFASFLDLPIDVHTELNHIKSEIKNLMLDSYGKCSFYEHGRNFRGSFEHSLSPCFHAHMHILPVNLDVFKLMNVITNHIAEGEIPQSSVLPKQEYLLQSLDGFHWEVYHPTEELAKNCMRGFIAKALKIEGRANWKDTSAMGGIKNDYVKTFLNFESSLST